MVKKGIYKIKNSSGTYDDVYLKTSSDMVIETNDKLFVSQTEKTTWNGKANSSHNHTSLTGITSLAFKAESSDRASISTTIDGTNTYFDFNLADDVAQSDQWRWRFSPSNGTLYDAMILNPISLTEAELKVKGQIYANGNKVYHTGNKPTLGDIGAAAASHTHTRTQITNAYQNSYKTLSSSADLNEIYTPGLYTSDSDGNSANIVNRPPGTTGFILEVHQIWGSGTTGRQIQYAYMRQSGDVYSRWRNENSSWTAWILKTVSIGTASNQAAAGNHNHSYLLVDNNETKNSARLQMFQTHNNTALMPDTEWWSLLRLQHGGYTNGYWQEIATSFGSDIVKFRRNQNGSYGSWKTFAFTDSSITGNASTATKLQTARTIALTGAVTGSVNFDGSGNASITTSEGNVSFKMQTTPITNTSDWNEIITPGCYKIQMSSWGSTSLGGPNNYSSSIYSYGLLLVFKSGVASEDRTVQIYMPHNDSSAPIVTRMSNSNSWKAWKPMWRGLTLGDLGGITQSTADNRYMRQSYANGFYGITASGDDSNWVRTTVNGIIPYQSGGSSSLGTSSWNFNSVYSKNIYENNVLLTDKYAAKAHTHNYAGSSSAGGAANSANKLNVSVTRPASANTTIVGDGTITTFKSTGNMTTSKPFCDGTIFNMEWDNTGGYTHQLFIPNAKDGRMQFRGMSQGTWGDWNTVYSTNYKPTAADVGAAASNHSHSYVPLSGGTLTGALNFANNLWNKFGDDVSVGDCNKAGMLGIKGANGNTGIYLAPYSGSTASTITADGSGTVTISGTTKSTNFNMTSGLQYNGTTILRNNGTSSILSSKGGTLYLRPSGDGSTTGEVSIQTDGTINTNGSINSQHIRCKTDNAYEVGSSSKYFSKVFTYHLQNFMVKGSSGRRWTIVPVVESDGVMEIGMAIDFHSSSGSTADYSGRIEYISNTSSSSRGFCFSNYITPRSNASYDLGTSGGRWRNLYLINSPNVSSKRAMKTNIKIFDDENAYEHLKDLNIYTYNFKKFDKDGNWNGEIDAENMLGSIYEELPIECIHEEAEGVDLYAYTSYAISALKHAIKKIEVLEKKVAELSK